MAQSFIELNKAVIHVIRTIIPKKFSHCCENSRAHKQISQPGDQVKELKIPREHDFEGQWDLITELP